MRVALLVHTFPSPEHPYISDWAGWLNENGVDLTVMPEQCTGPIPGIEVIPLNRLDEPAAALKQALRRPIKPLAQALAAARELRRIDPPRTVLRKCYEYWPLFGRHYDIVHFNAPQIAVRRLELGRLLGNRTLVSFRGQDFSHHPSRYDRILEQADHFHFLSTHLLALAQERGYRGGRHSLIPPLVDTDYYRPMPRQSSTRRLTLFSAARLSWTKGWEYALQAVALLVKAGLDVEYSIAGEGDFRDMVLFTIHDLGLEDRVRLLGWVSPEGVRDRIQAADVYLLASVEEGFNNSVIQAQACGVPVVCSDAGGLPENIVHEETGLVARRRDAWDLAAKLRRLLERPEERERMGGAGRQRALRCFARQDVLPRFLEMYRSVAEEPGMNRISGVAA